MDAIVTAGGVPQPGEGLYEFTRGECKAYLDILGKPMVQWVLDALNEASRVERVVIVGLPDGSMVSSPKLAAMIPSQGDLFDNVRAGVRKMIEIDPTPRHVLSVSSDIPAITGEMVDWLVAAAMQSDEDIYYNVITRQVMESRFPASKRSYTRLKDVEVCGGDLNVIRTLTVTANDELWRRIVAARKNVFKQAALIGYDTLILLLLRLVTLEQAVRIVTRRMNITGRAIVCPYAEIGMDIDKPFQLEIVRADLARRMAGRGPLAE